MPNAELKVYDDSGHAPSLKESERFKQYLPAFVRSSRPASAQWIGPRRGVRARFLGNRVSETLLTVGAGSGGIMGPGLRGDPS